MALFKETSTHENHTMIDYIIDFGSQYKFYLKFSSGSHGIVSKEVFDSQHDNLRERGYEIEFKKIKANEIDEELIRNQIKIAFSEDPDSPWKRALDQL